MAQNYIYPFWTIGKKKEEYPIFKLPKHLRKKGSLQLRKFKNIKVNKETGEYCLR